MSTAVLEHLRAEARTKLEQAQEIATKAHDNGRPMTTYERGRVEALLADVDTLNEERKGIADSVELTERIDALNARMSPGAPGTKGLGDTLLEAGLMRTGDPHRLSVKNGMAGVVVLSWPIFGPDGFKAPTVPTIGDLARSTPPYMAELGRDQRFLFPNLPQQNAGDALSIQDFRQTVRSSPAGVERSPTDVTAKATLDATITAVNDPMRQVAAILNAIPNAVLESMPGFRSFAQDELRFTLAKALDAHVYTNLNAGASFGNTGTGLVAQLRNAVTALQAAGFAPDLAILNPADAATLDLTVDTAGSFLFALREVGASSPLWGLKLVTRTSAAGNEPPLVVDTRAVGVLYMGTLSVDLDPFAGVAGNNFATNRTDIRAEQNALMHIRRPLAARRIAAT